MCAAASVKRGLAPLVAGLLAVPLSSARASAHRPDLRVLAAGATESALRAVVVAFEAERGRVVDVAYGPVGALRNRIVAGDPADLVIATPAILEPLSGRGLLRPGPRFELGRVGGGIAVRKGEPIPRVGTPGELREALLSAEAIYLVDPAVGTAGAYGLEVADRLGVGAIVRGKVRLAAGGKEAMRLMASSTAHAIGLGQVSEILSVTAVVLVGPYPPPLEKFTPYVGAVLAGAADPELAKAFLRFLASAPAQARFRAAGFEPARATPGE